MSFTGAVPALRSVGGGLPHYVAIFGFRINCFGASMALHWCSGLPARGTAKTALSAESFNRLVARAAVSTATGCNDCFPGGTFTRWTPTPFSRRTTSINSVSFQLLA
jgi:hypothetical protein